MNDRAPAIFFLKKCCYVLTSVLEHTKMLKCYYTSSSVVVLILSSAWLYSMFLDENYSEVSVYQKITIRICCLKL
jgi:hypothetical protein